MAAISGHDNAHGHEQPPPTPPVLAGGDAEAFRGTPAVAPDVRCDPSTGGDAEAFQRRPYLQLLGPKASPMAWLEAQPRQLLPRAGSPLPPSTQSQRTTGALTPGGMPPCASTPGGVELLAITDIPACSHPLFRHESTSA